MVRTVLSLDVSTQAVFLYHISVTYTLRVYFWCFWCPCYALVVTSNRWNQYNFSTLHRLHTLLHRWILVLLLIFVDWYEHSNTNVAGSKCILNRNWCIIWRPKRDIWSKCPHYILGYMINVGPMSVLCALVLNLAYTNYWLCQNWSVYMQYLWRCDHSNNCLFLVTRQVEVLLNISSDCIPMHWYIYNSPRGKHRTRSTGHPDYQSKVRPDIEPWRTPHVIFLFQIYTKWYWKLSRSYPSASRLHQLITTYYVLPGLPLWILWCNLNPAMFTKRNHPEL